MGFEDDLNFNDSFENEAADLDADFSADKPKKLSRKDLREAKRKNAEKTADLPKQKKGLFAKHTRMDDDDSLSGDHMFDPNVETKVSMPREHKYDHENDAPIMNDQSEFSYLFDSNYDDASDDDFYPDESIYSDRERARELLGGLAYDESRDGDSSDFDRYFSEDAQVRPESKFTFHRHEEKSRELPDLSLDNGTAVESPVKSEPAKAVKVTPTVVGTYDGVNEGRSSSFKDDTLFPPPFGTVSEPPPPVGSMYDKSEESYMSQENNDVTKETDAYPASDVYTPYPMPPMMGYPMNMGMPMNMGYPMNLTSAQNIPQGGMPYQTIPIPIPVMMPYPMYQYPPMYPPPYDPYDRYYDDRRSPYYDRYYDDRQAEYDRRYQYDQGGYPDPPYYPPYESSEYRRSDVPPQHDRYNGAGRVDYGGTSRSQNNTSGYGGTSYGQNDTSGYGGTSYGQNDTSGYGGTSYGQNNTSGYGGTSYGQNNTSGYGGTSYGQNDTSCYGGTSYGQNDTSGYGGTSYGQNDTSGDTSGFKTSSFDLPEPIGLTTDNDPISMPVENVPETDGFKISDDGSALSDTGASSEDFSLEALLSTLPDAPPKRENVGISEPTSNTDGSESGFEFDFDSPNSGTEEKSRGGRFNRRR